MLADGVVEPDEKEFLNNLMVRLEIAGDRALVGSPFKSTGLGFMQGTAYTYERNQLGDWIELDFFVAEATGNGDRLGTDVALSDSGLRGIVGSSGGGAPTIAGSAFGQLQPGEVAVDLIVR